MIVIDEVKTEDADAGPDAAPSDEQSQLSTSLLQPESQQLSAATGETVHMFSLLEILGL